MRVYLAVIGILLLFTGTAAAGSDFSTANITCTDTEQQLRNKGAAGITFDGLHVYAGYRQVTSINQNPLITAFDVATGARVFCREDYEQTGVDGRAAALHTDGNNLYVYIRVDGGFSSSPLLTAASNNTQGWTRSVGAGAGSGNFAVVARLNPTDGAVTDAAFLTAVLSNGNPNSLGVVGFACTGQERVRVQTEAFFGPRRINGNRMTWSGTGDSPFDYTVDLSANLRDVTYASAPLWETVGTSATVTACPLSQLGIIGVPVQDVIDDERITPRDVIFVINRLDNTPTGNDAPADVDNDNDIDTDDVTRVIRWLGRSA